MLWGEFDSFKSELLRQYEDGWNTESGKEPAELYKEALKIEKNLAGEPKITVKARIIEHLLDNAMLSVNPHEWFADRINDGGIMLRLRQAWQESINSSAMSVYIEKNKEAQQCLAYTGDVDFGHTSPDWDAVMRLGLTGLIDRLNNNNAINLSADQMVFREAAVSVLEAVRRYAARLADEAEKYTGKAEKSSLTAANLRALINRPPQTLTEAFQLAFIYYQVQHHIEGENLRSLGGLDRLYYRFYKSDIEKGLYTEEQEREFIRDFLWKFRAKKIEANIPFFLCGRDPLGNDATNDLTYIILEEYIGLNIQDPKIHIRCHEKLPERIIRMVMSSVRNGKNSFVFMNDEIVEKALRAIGEEPRDTREYTVIGCYESAAAGKEIPCTCNGRINIPKAVEAAIFDGIDPLTGKLIGEKTEKIHTSFEKFYKAVIGQLKYFADKCMELISGYEKYYPEINPAPLLSSTMAECAEKYTDAYSGGAKYNNSSINAFGIATAIDSLIAVKKAVFEEKLLSLEEFGVILKNNWVGSEKLRRRCSDIYPKYGNNNAEADSLTVRLVKDLSGLINGKPNGRGGVFRYGMFSIDWRFPFGEKTGATPDGRFAGSTLSKNMSAGEARDINGVTSLINSVTKIDFTGIPNGTALDLVLHSSAAAGEDGMSAMTGLLKAFLNSGGLALQMNILDPAVLRKAQETPEKYASLQVRLCGWNVYFVNLSKKEQEEFIRQAERAAV